MRYQDSGYFFITDMKSMMIMHPIKPALDGTDQTENKDPTGKRIFVEFAKKVAAEGKGFVDYYWPKPGAEEPVLKYSHVAGFAPWGWIVGTGVYADDLAAMFTEGLIQVAVICAFAALVILLAAFSIVRSVVGPIERLKASMRAIADEDVSSAVPETGRKDEIGQMAAVLVVLRDSVKERIGMRQREAEQQSQLDAERRSNEHRAQSDAQTQADAMGAIGSALEKLASGDLTAEIATIAPEYSKLRDDFNTAVGALRGVYPVDRPFRPKWSMAAPVTFPKRPTTCRAAPSSRRPHSNRRRRHSTRSPRRSGAHPTARPKPAKWLMRPRAAPPNPAISSATPLPR